jgi:hypothetical protein
MVKYSYIKLNSGNGNTNNFWRYDIDSKLYTWISGDNTGYAATPFYGRRFIPSPTVQPGGRIYAAGMYDKMVHSFFVYGGLFEDGTVCNSMFRIDLLSLFWSWESGNFRTGTESDFGITGVENSTNLPSSRYALASFTDTETRSFYVFGGVNMLAGTSIELRLGGSYVWVAKF